VSEPVAPLPLTARNLALGAGWTLLVFVCLVTLLTGNIVTILFAGQGFGALALGGFGAGYAFFLSGAVGIVATAFIGVPLTIAVSLLLRRSRSVRAHAWGAAAAGGLSMLVLLGLYALFTLPSTIAMAEAGISTGVDGAALLATLAVYAALFVVTGASSAAGWLLAWRQHRAIATIVVTTSTESPA